MTDKTASPAVSEKPRILIIALDKVEEFDDMYSHMVDALSETSRLQRTSRAATVIRILKEDPPAAVLVVDPGVVKSSNKFAFKAIREYIAQGGTTVFAAYFVSMISPAEMNRMWQRFDLSWHYGDFHRTDTGRWSKHMKMPKTLPLAYSQKAVHLQSVHYNTAIWTYRTVPGFEPSLDAPSTKRTHTKQCAAVLFPYGAGRLGYVGDVNAEQDSTAVIGHMCGVL